VLADGARLPVADARVDAVAALYTLYHYADPFRPVGEARRVLRPGGLFAACAPGPRQRAGTGRRAAHLGRPVYLRRRGRPRHRRLGVQRAGDRLDVAAWDGPLSTLSTAGHAASFLRCHGMSEDAAAGAAAALDLPLTLTMRGCVVYATKG
jgi:SAM-dependent methyltransferase